MDPLFLLVLFGVLALVWTAIWGWVLISARYPAPQSDIDADAAILRRRLTYTLSGLTVAIFASTIYFLPYSFMRKITAGKPDITVHVVGRQWVWQISRTKLPLGVPIQFDVTAADVNHGFGIYDPEGHLVGETQAMPGFTNHLIYTFRQRGVYMIRCLEYCGTPHFLMVSKLTIV